MFLRYFFYKNFCFTVAQLWYGFYNGGSAMTNFDPLFISFFNVVFAFLGVIVVAILEQDVDADRSMQNPKLYAAGPKNVYFSYKMFFTDLFRGVLHSIVLFFFIVAAFSTGGGVREDGLVENDLYVFGVFLSFILVLIVNFQLAIEIRHWSWAHWVGVTLGVWAWFFLFGIVYTRDDTNGLSGMSFMSPFYGTFGRTLESPTFWLSSLLCMAVTSLPNIFTEMVTQYRNPTPKDLVAHFSKYKYILGSASTPRCNCGTCSACKAATAYQEAARS
jgi:magnesium-transporting ATPase (P-type)